MSEFLVQQIFATIFSLNNKIQENGNKLSTEMTLRQFMVILAIEHISPENCSYNRIAEKLGTSKQNVKQMVSGLGKKGFISIAANEEDRRAVKVSITRIGYEAAFGFAKASQGFIKHVADKFPEEDLQQLWSLLKKLYAFDGVEMNGFDDHDF
jgi:DNA-binding MarR family transcriptional regulator